MPDDTTSRFQPRVQLRAIEGYRVNEDFPQLTRSAVPSAVTDAHYTLDLRAITSHAIDPSEVLDIFCRTAA
jgi:hypothetical protein